MIRRLLKWSLGGLLVALALGCAPSYAPPAPREGVPSDGPGPSIEVLSPTEGQKISGSEAKVTIKVSNFKLSNPAAVNRPGEGHWHLLLDGASAPIMVYTETTTVKVGRPGQHELVAFLVNHNHSPLSPDVRKKLSFTTE